MNRFVKSVANKFGVDVAKYRNTTFTQQMDESNLEVLDDPAFIASIEKIDARWVRGYFPKSAGDV